VLEAPLISSSGVKACSNYRNLGNWRLEKVGDNGLIFKDFMAGMDAEDVSVSAQELAATAALPFLSIRIWECVLL